MKESIWGYWIVVLGISIISVMILLQSYSTTNEQDYFLIKSVLQSSMLEAVDYGYFSDTGKMKMNKEKFVENFVRRFSETVNIQKEYDINFYNIYEMPPAASVSVKSNTNQTNLGSSNGLGSSQSVESTNRLTGILYTTTDFVETAGKTGNNSNMGICVTDDI